MDTELEKLDAQKLPSSENEVKKMFEKATLLRNDRRFDEAIAIYAEAAASKNVTADFLQQARLNKLDTELDKIRSQHPTFVTQILDVLKRFATSKDKHEQEWAQRLQGRFMDITRMISQQQPPAPKVPDPTLPQPKLGISKTTSPG